MDEGLAKSLDHECWMGASALLQQECGHFNSDIESYSAERHHSMHDGPQGASGAGTHDPNSSVLYGHHFLRGILSPQPLVNRKVPAWRKGVPLLSDWMLVCMQRTTARSTFFGACDLNDDFETLAAPELTKFIGEYVRCDVMQGTWRTSCLPIN